MLIVSAQGTGRDRGKASTATAAHWPVVARQLVSFEYSAIALFLLPRIAHRRHNRHAIGPKGDASLTGHHL